MPLTKIETAKIILRSIAPFALLGGSGYAVYSTFEYRANHRPADKSCLELIKIEKEVGKFGVLIDKIAKDGMISQGECDDFRDEVMNEDRLEAERKEKAEQEALVNSIINDEPDIPQEDLEEALPSDLQPAPVPTRSPIKQPTKG